jgi:hypothetical protein
MLAHSGSAQMGAKECKIRVSSDNVRCGGECRQRDSEVEEGENHAADPSPATLYHRDNR